MAIFTDKNAVVTGAGQGLGLACAKFFARDWAHVVIADIDPQTAEAAAKLIRESGGRAAHIVTDIANPADVERMVAFVVETFGGLDFAVNNAMIGIPSQPIAEIDFADWKRTTAVNYDGAFLSMKYEIPAILARGGGALVNIGSGREYMGKPGLSWYLLAKQAVYGMTKCAAMDTPTRDCG